MVNGATPESGDVVRMTRDCGQSVPTPECVMYVVLNAQLSVELIVTRWEQTSGVHALLR